MTAANQDKGAGNGANDRKQIQFERLQATLNRACRNVPFHREQQNGVAVKTGRDPSVIERTADVAGLPFMNRGDLSAHYPYGLFAVPLRDIVRIHTVPGTGVNPTVNGYTRQDLRVWREVVSRSLAAAGVGPNDIIQISLDPGLANWARDYKDGAESLEAAVIPNSPLSPGKQLMVLRDYKSTVLVTTTSEASQLAARMFDEGINATAFNLKTLVLVGEPAERAVRAELEAALHVRTWLHYGLSEVPGPSIAFECGEHHGLHISEDHFLPEIVNPETGAVMPEGEAGELVLTTLTTRAFPLIRFRTGEQARLLPEPCPCGNPLPRMEWLPERLDGILNINGVRVHPNQIERCIAAEFGFLPKYRFEVLREPGQKNRLEVSLCMEERLFSDEIRLLQRNIWNVGDRLKEELGVPVRVRLREGYAFA